MAIVVTMPVVTILAHFGFMTPLSSIVILACIFTSCLFLFLLCVPFLTCDVCKKNLIFLNKHNKQREEFATKRLSAEAQILLDVVRKKRLHCRNCGTVYFDGV